MEEEEEEVARMKFLNHGRGFRSRRDGWFSTIVNRMPSM
jgi:hypothetical protein